MSVGYRVDYTDIGDVDLIDIVDSDSNYRHLTFRRNRRWTATAVDWYWNWIRDNWES